MVLHLILYRILTIPCEFYLQFLAPSTLPCIITYPAPAPAPNTNKISPGQTALIYAKNTAQGVLKRSKQLLYLCSVLELIIYSEAVFIFRCTYERSGGRRVGGCNGFVFFPPPVYHKSVFGQESVNNSVVRTSCYRYFDCILYFF